MNTTSAFTAEELRGIAGSQKAIIGLILLNLIIGVAILYPFYLLEPGNKSAAGFVLATRGIAILLDVVAAVLIFRVARALRRTAWVYAVAAFFPCIGLVTLLLVNHHATQTLRQNGVRVGLLGARQSDLVNIPFAPRPRVGPEISEPGTSSVSDAVCLWCERPIQPGTTVCPHCGRSLTS
jgi:hypothetical protein